MASTRSFLLKIKKEKKIMFGTSNTISILVVPCEKIWCKMSWLKMVKKACFFDFDPSRTTHPPLYWTSPLVFGPISNPPRSIHKIEFLVDKGYEHS